jgi:hypothetical protein
MRRRIAALLMVVGVMLATAAPAALAQGEGGSDPQPGQTEKARAGHGPPSEVKPGLAHRNTQANAHDPSDPSTGFGRRVEEQQG